MDFFDGLDLDWKLTAIVVAVILGASVLSKISRWSINRFFTAASHTLKLDPTRYKFFKNAASLIIWFSAFGIIISTIPTLKSIALTLFAGAGILVAIIGFAAQEAFSNIIGGIFIVIFKPFGIGDMIKVGSLDYGEVEDITLRHTIINNFENKRIIIPNSVINSETIVNDSIGDSKVCRFIEVGISYDSSIDLAMKIMQEEAMNHPRCIDTRSAKDKQADIPQVEVRTIGFGDSSVNLRAFVWTSDPFQANRMHSDINKSIKERFDKEGIEIPFPYRTVVYKNDLPKNS
ncbi:MAG: mechanosensitive ion channel family protein [Reichenbachiella sp.]